MGQGPEAPGPIRCGDRGAGLPGAGDRKLTRREMAMFRALVTNPPWPGDGYGARASVRWPHKRKDKKLEYPIFLSYAVALAREAGIETSFLDGVCDELGIEDYAVEVDRLAPDLIAMEWSTPANDHELASVRRIKELRPRTSAGPSGSHPAYFH